MDDGGQHENGRHKTDSYRGSLYPWNMMPPHQGKEQQNALAKNKKIMSILAEREAAIRERNLALTEKKEALAARDAALAQRDKALAERDKALMERDNALAALQYRESSINFPTRMHHPPNHPADMVDISNYMGGVHVHITDAFPISSISSEAAKSCNKRKQPKESKTGLSKSPRKAKTIGEDLNKHVIPEGKKYRTEWDSQDVGLNLIAFDESIMPGPVCSCTGVPHQCYKWGNGGWQSSCCTTTMSQYPLPQMQNKRHTRVGGRKMSGSVFARLISRLAADGHDLLVPVDLKDYWARHGTNRYITIK